MVRKRLNNSNTLKLCCDIENPDSPKPFELLKGNQKFGRKYSERSVRDLLYSLKQNYDGVLTITPEARTALGLEALAE